MSKKVAIVGGLVTATILGGTFLYSQMHHDNMPCGSSAMAGAEIGGPFELVSETGETITDADVITEPTLVYFGYTFCPDVCPLDSARNAAAVDILAEQGISVTPLFITVDPDRDNVEVVGDFTENFHPKMIGLTGSDEQINAAKAAYRAVGEKEEGGDPDYYLVQHSTFTYLEMPGQGVVEFFRQTTSAEEMAETTACFASMSGMS